MGKRKCWPMHLKICWSIWQVIIICYIVYVQVPVEYVTWNFKPHGSLQKVRIKNTFIFLFPDSILNTDHSNFRPQWQVWQKLNMHQLTKVLHFTIRTKIQVNHWKIKFYKLCLNFVTINFFKVSNKIVCHPTHISSVVNTMRMMPHKLRLHPSSFRGHSLRFDLHRPQHRHKQKHVPIIGMTTINITPTMRHIE